MDAQRAAVEEAAPQLLELFDELVRQTRALAGAEVTGMRTVRTVAELRELLAPERRAGRSDRARAHDGLLPRRPPVADAARQRAPNDVVVVSLFVNPAQFGPGEDLEAYPRDEQRDERLAEAEGVDVLFAPPVEEVYPEGFATTVAVGDLTEMLEGDQAQRGTEHFQGVTTVVTKLFNMAAPDVAYFGQKDAQQALVIRKLVRDLDIPVRIEVCPTIRDPDGLALSSRNAYLSPAERERALALSRALRAAEAAVAGGDPRRRRGRGRGARRAGPRREWSRTTSSSAPPTTCPPSSA